MLYIPTWRFIGKNFHKLAKLSKRTRVWICRICVRVICHFLSGGLQWFVPRSITRCRSFLLGKLARFVHRMIRTDLVCHCHTRFYFRDWIHSLYFSLCYYLNFINHYTLQIQKASKHKNKRKITLYIISFIAKI